MMKSKDPLYAWEVPEGAFRGLDMGDVCRPREERPAGPEPHPLWSGPDTVDGYKATDAPWEIFDPVNG